MRSAPLLLATLALVGCEETKRETDLGSASATVAATATASAKPAPPKADPSRLQLEGKPIQGGLMTAKVEPGTRGIKFPGHKVVIADDGTFLIAFFYKGPAKEMLTVTFPDGAVLEHHFEVEQRTYADDAIDGMPERFFKLPPERAKKMRKLTKEIEAVRKKYTKKAYYKDGCFQWPITGKLTSRFGQNRLFNKKHKDIHWGVDIARPVGTPVKAPCGGTITFALADVPLAGNTVIIDHGHGLSSTLIHLQNIAVKVGQEVKPGDVIGTVGMTGRTNGPHLDWRMNFFTIRIDPELLAPPMPE